MAIVRRVDSHLGDENWRGKLVLRYPSREGQHFKVIPFFENPEISESQNPRYANYAVVARSSNLFGYLGADSRKINLSFKLTLPNIVAVGGKFDYVFTTPATKLQKQAEIMDTAEYRQELADQLGDSAMADSIIDKAVAESEFALKRSKGAAQEYEEKYFEILDDEEKNILRYLRWSSPMYHSDNNKDSITAGYQRVALNAIGSFVAAIRSTVINNAADTQYGPPMVRLHFGMLYNDVPCVCKGYNIKVNQKAGYDKTTLLPRVLDVTMKLEEARNLADNTTKYRKNTQDNLVGYEVILGTNREPGANMDPGYYRKWSDFGSTGR
jgi:hypothetical protein